ncbi:hypothetical protein [Methanolapillus millepedarum]|uniref:Uncharacterized protein n=1 Tax=Methanolapillus millepedarum TaxID=3028296 RepID=A0AA96VD27_9EURY|nr:hypothetical protein MsAc7_00340 [Methanosarcinaceae archaeon Ac7]
MSLKIIEKGRFWAVNIDPQAASKSEKDEFMKLLYERGGMDELLYNEYLYGNDTDRMFHLGITLNNMSWFGIDYAATKEKVDTLLKNQEHLLSIINEMKSNA